MWFQALDNFILTCDAYGNGKFGNCSTLRYFLICHYTWRWLLTLSLQVWAKKFCRLIVYFINYLRCLYMTYHFEGPKGFFFGVLLLEGRNGQTWKDHVHNCAPCHLLHVDGHIDLSLVVIIVGLCYMLCRQATRATTMLICNKCSKGRHIGCLTPPLLEVLVDKWFCPRCTRLTQVFIFMA